MKKLSKIQYLNRIQLIKRAYFNNCAHIPSALSMIDYFYWLNKKINYKKDALIIGKPFGQLAYHTIWNSNNNLLINGKTKKVIWADSTIGNCLGIACGLALSNKYKKIIINTSDASIQEGTMLEAIQFIGTFKKFKANIVLCVDCNKYQCTCKLFQTIYDLKRVFKAFSWNTLIINGHNDNTLKTLHLDYEKPTCILFNTIKGYGIDIIEKNPIEWHYKTLTYNNYINILKTLKYASSNR